MANDVTELVDDFRRPMKDIDSLFLRVDVVVLPTVDWRGTREVATGAPAEGEARTEEGCRTLGVAPSSLSNTPNSFVLILVGDALAEGAASPLALLVAKAEPECFNGGEAVADVRLEMRGIFVGVSFGRPDTEFMSVDGGPSFKVCVLLVPLVAIDGLPAMVGS